MTEYTTSADGTRIVYDRHGAGPVVLMIGGAMQFRALDQATDRLARLLADRGWTAVHYDRRGRGDSDTAESYTLADELADLAALLAVFDEDVTLYGSSSGGAVALAAACAGLPVAKLALWEVPLGPELGRDGTELLAELRRRIAQGDDREVIRFFMDGMPPEWVEPAVENPEIVAMAPSLASDADALAWTQSAPRAELWGDVTQPTLVLLGEETLPMMPAAADEIVAAVPQARKATINAAGHGWEPEVMADALDLFLRATSCASPGGGTESRLLPRSRVGSTAARERRGTDENIGQIAGGSQRTGGRGHESRPLGGVIEPGDLIAAGNLHEHPGSEATAQ